MSNASPQASALFKQSYNSNRPRNYGSVAIEIESVNSKESVDKSHPGIVNGKVLSGPLTGEAISFSMRDTGSNGSGIKVADLQKKTSRSYTPAGGVIHVDGLLKDGDNYTVSWMNRMSEDPKVSPVIAGEMARIAPVLQATDNGNWTVRKGKNGATLYRANILHGRDTVAATSVEAMEKAVISAFNNDHGAPGDTGSRGVLLVALRSGDEGAMRDHLSASRYDREKGIISPEAALERIYERSSRGTIASIFESGGKIDVIPTSTFLVGGKTAQMIDEKSASGSRPQVDVPHYKMDDGKYGYSRTSLALKYFTDENGDPQAGAFIFRAYGATKAVPLQAVATMSDPDATSRYYDQRQAADVSKEGPSAQQGEPRTEAKAESQPSPSAEPKAEAKAETGIEAAEPKKSSAMDGFEALLDEVSEDDFDLGDEQPAMS